MTQKDTNRMNTPELSDDALDLLLSDALASSEDEIRPSSGFAASVMETIEAPATIPPPIPFPWRRVLPGIAILACAMVAFIVLGLRTPLPEPAATAAWHWSFSPFQTELCWVLIAAVLSLAGVAASLRLTRGKS